MTDVALKTLSETIQRQERVIAELRAKLQALQNTSVESMLGRLRLHEAVLLYVGKDRSNFTERIAKDYGSEVSRSVLNNLFDLHNSPLTPDIREAIREATNYGMNRW